LVLYETERGNRRVAYCSPPARAGGVTTGMPLAEVAALDIQIPPCIEPHEPAADREALEALAGWCQRFSPTVGLEEAAEPESLLLDITGLAHLFGGEAAIAEQVIGAFARRGLAVRVAVADTVGAAWAVAHFGTGSLVPSGTTPAVLAALPVEALRLPPKTVELLHGLGVYRIEQLKRLPRDELSIRFGPRLLGRLDQAMGRTGEVIVSFRPPTDWRTEWSLDYPTTRRATIEAILEQLIGRLAVRLRSADRGAVRLECRLQCRPADPLTFAVGLFRPSAVAGHLWSLVRAPLERLRLVAPVTAISVEAPIVAPLPRQQRNLFPDGSARQHAVDLAALIDRLGSRLGSEAVTRVRLVAEAQPERAYRYEPLTAKRRRRASPDQSHLLPRPLQLFWEPLALEMVAMAPGGPPSRFHLRGHVYRIARSWGPERIETGWWRGRSTDRDYYRVETTTGHRLWLFRRLADNRWFLHGLFS